VGLQIASPNIIASNVQGFVSGPMSKPSAYRQDGAEPCLNAAALLAQEVPDVYTHQDFACDAKVVDKSSVSSRATWIEETSGFQLDRRPMFCVLVPSRRKRFDASPAVKYLEVVRWRV
jgi:hypothetical protein